MTIVEQVKSALENWPQPKGKGHGVLVPTNCLYAGGAIVAVFVTGGADTFYVHDDAGGVRDFENCGGDFAGAAKMAGNLLRDRGLRVDQDGRISAPPVTVDGLAAAIAIVANASRDTSDHLLGRWRPARRRNFKELVADLVSHEFPKRWAREVAIAGRSNKLHRFDFVIELGADRRLLLDAVVPEATAINTAVVRNLDVHSADRKDVTQRILYDDALVWKASDLALLRIGAPPIAYTAARTTLEHLH